MTERDLATLTAGDFAPYTGEPFAVAGTLDGFVLTLTAVRHLGTAPTGLKRAPFALDLAGPSATPLAQGTYRLTNAGFGAATIFLVPVGEAALSRFYEAVFT